MSSITSTNQSIEVYRSNRLQDLLESPMFYAVILITFTLGFFSVYGFIQNPLKLRAAVDTVRMQVSSSSISSSRISLNAPYSLNDHILKKKPKTVEPVHIFSIDNLTNSIHQDRSSIKRISFDYDITSNTFWHNLDTSNLEKNNKFVERNDLLIGAPLESEYYLKQGDFKYSLIKPTRLKL